MIGKKEVALVNTGRKLVKRYKSNFSEFTSHDFYVRIDLADTKTGLFCKRVELKVNSDNWMDYLDNAIDLKDYKVLKVEFSATGQ